MLAMGKILHGWAISLLGSGDAGIAELSQGREMWRTNGSRLVRPYWSALLADALRAAGKHEDATTELAGAFTEMESGEERWFERTLCTLKATLLVDRTSPGHSLT